MAKLLEHLYRNGNIALVNELTMLGDRMTRDAAEVVEVAAAPPCGFMRLEPGPGVGGHCIPVDPLSLAWAAREYDFGSPSGGTRSSPRPRRRPSWPERTAC
jgi:UDP-N-acetyl-D-glucosamine dehydrogenase